MFFFSDVSTDYFCCSVEWCVARRKHSHFGLCGEGPSDHRGMPMLNSSKLICSPQRQSREKFLKYCPLLQAACWTNRLTKWFWPWDLAWSVKNRQALASVVFQVAWNYLMRHYWKVHGEDPRVQCAKKKKTWGLKRSSLSLLLCKKAVPFLPPCWMSSSHPFLPHWPCTQLLQCKCWTWRRGNFSALSATFEPTNKTRGSLSELPGIPWPLPRLQRNWTSSDFFFLNPSSISTIFRSPWKSSAHNFFWSTNSQASCWQISRKTPFSQGWWLWGQQPHWVPQDDGKYPQPASCTNTTCPGIRALFTQNSELLLPKFFLQLSCLVFLMYIPCFFISLVQEANWYVRH